MIKKIEHLSNANRGSDFWYFMILSIVSSLSFFCTQTKANTPSLDDTKFVAVVYDYSKSTQSFIGTANRVPTSAKSFSKNDLTTVLFWQYAEQSGDIISEENILTARCLDHQGIFVVLSIHSLYCFSATTQKAHYIYSDKDVPFAPLLALNSSEQFVSIVAWKAPNKWELRLIDLIGGKVLGKVEIGNPSGMMANGNDIWISDSSGTHHFSTIRSNTLDTITLRKEADFSILGSVGGFYQNQPIIFSSKLGIIWIGNKQLIAVKMPILSLGCDGRNISFYCEDGNLYSMDVLNPKLHLIACIPTADCHGMGNHNGALWIANGDGAVTVIMRPFPRLINR